MLDSCIIKWHPFDVSCPTCSCAFGNYQGAVQSRALAMARDQAICLSRSLLRPPNCQNTYKQTGIHHHSSSFIIIHHHSSSFIIIHHHSSSFIIIHHHSSSFIIIHHHSSSFIIIHHHSSPFITIHHHSSSFIIIHHHSSSFIIIHHHSSSFIIIHHHSSSFIIIHQYPSYQIRMDDKTIQNNAKRMLKTVEQVENCPPNMNWSITEQIFPAWNASYWPPKKTGKASKFIPWVRDNPWPCLGEFA